MSEGHMRGTLNEKGFTLLEVMIALAILAGVLVAVLGSLNYNMGVASGDTDLVMATVIGKELSEESSLAATVQDSEGVLTGAFSKFSWSLRKSDTEIQGLKRVDIKITWDKDRSVAFVSFRREG